jgi:hypothetical protein
MIKKNIDFENLDGEQTKYINFKTNLENDIRELSERIDKLNEAKINIKPDDLKLSAIFDLNSNNSDKILQLKYKLIEIKSKLESKRILFPESQILIEKDFTDDWIKQSGGTVDDYKKNLDELNKITQLNKKIRELLIVLEKYKSITTDLLIKYNEFVRETYNILVYSLYKITAFNHIKYDKIIIDFKFKKDILNELRDKINNKKRKNFSFVKELYIKVIDDLTNKLDNSGKKYIDFKTITNHTALINIIVLVHLYKFTDLI